MRVANKNARKRRGNSVKLMTTDVKEGERMKRRRRQERRIKKGESEEKKNDRQIEEKGGGGEGRERRMGKGDIDGHGR